MVSLELTHCAHSCFGRYLDPSSGYLLENLSSSTDPKWRPLSTAICNVVRTPSSIAMCGARAEADGIVVSCHQINDFSMVAFVPMNITREESIETVLLHVDHAINYGEDLEPSEPKDDAEDDF